MKNPTILAFGAHPDDLEFGCGGILLKAVKNGAQLHTRVASKGEAGSAGTPEIRKEEAEAAARLMGATLKFLDFGGDCHLEDSVANRIAIAREIRQVQPDILIAPFLQENQHPDHVVMARLVRDAARLARYGGLAELKDLPVHRIAALYYYAGTAHHESPPDIFVDISGVFEQWIEVIQAHHSQVTNKKYREMLEMRARYFGTLGKVEFALPLWKNDPHLVESIEDLPRMARDF